MFMQSGSGSRTWRFYVLGTLIVVIGFVAVIEFATRAVSWASGKGFTLAPHELDPTDSAVTEMYQWHPFTGLTMKPGGRFYGSHPNSPLAAEQLVDRHGFLALDDSLALDKPKDEIRIATIGASTTANLNLIFEDNWPGQLGAQVQKALPGKRVRVVNAAVPGFDTAQSLANLSLRVMPFKPDVVVIYHAYNDLKAVTPGKPFRADYSHIHEKPFGLIERPPFYLNVLHHSMFYVRTRNSYRKFAMQGKAIDDMTGVGRVDRVPPEAEAAFRQHMEGMIAIARAGGAKVVLSSFATLHDLSADYGKPATLQALSKLQREELPSLLHFTPGLTLPGIVDGLNRYNRALHDIAQKQRTGWVDNAAKVPHEDKYFVDRVHFSLDGARRMGENFAPAVIAELRK
jgi:lysophospholipase L1-like esterase